MIKNQSPDSPSCPCPGVPILMIAGRLHENSPRDQYRCRPVAEMSFGQFPDAVGTDDPDGEVSDQQSRAGMAVNDLVDDRRWRRVEAGVALVKQQQPRLRQQNRAGSANGQQRARLAALPGNQDAARGTRRRRPADASRCPLVIANDDDRGVWTRP
ncbi:MAG: hypothetical protein H0V10_16655 [Geodermatophilaceae bacterium]|nr:hypothetical protein [Geodermatophilaceae bacterium]